MPSSLLLAAKRNLVLTAVASS